jgi:hypothetical protein
MPNCDIVREIALALPGAEEQDHVGRPSFRVKGKIFSTLWPVENRAVVKLSLDDQAAFTAIDPAIFFPVPGGWGRMGMTFVQLDDVDRDLLEQAVIEAWRRVATKRLRAAFDQKEPSR